MPSSLADSSRDYARVAEAIAWLHAHQREQPDLAVLARQLRLSEMHVQRLFIRWAGISPKRFLQNLTLDYAHSQLAATRDLLSLRFAAGLSGAGRLHDLFVTLDAVTPGEARSGGLDMSIRYGVHPTPFGDALIAASARGICKLHFIAAGDKPSTLLRAEWPRAKLLADATSTAPLIAAIFHATRPAEPLALWVKGSNFQIQVWRALLAIPSGWLATYRAIAQGIGRPHAARAVGNAIAANPLAYLIPCHRVIRESGALGGYRWGIARKAAIQGWESVRGGDG